MRIRWPRLLPITGVVVILCIAWAALRPRATEPSYKGKPAGWWIRSIGGLGYGPTPSPSPGQYWFEPAFLPIVIRGLETPDRPLDQAYLQLWLRVPARMTKYLPRPFNAAHARDTCFMVLTENPRLSDKPAIPAMLRIYNAHPDQGHRQLAFLWLVAVGDSDDAVFRVVLDACHDPNWKTRRFAVRGLHSFAGSRDAVHAARTPAVLQALQDTLAHGDPVLQQDALGSLAQLGPDARPAVPSIIPLLNDPNPNTRRRAEEALHDIDQAALAAARQK